MNLMLWLVIGALLALAASFRALALRRQRLLGEAILSASGALMAGAIVVPADRWLSFDTDWLGLVAAAFGAAVMLLFAALRARRSERG